MEERSVNYPDRNNASPPNLTSVVLGALDLLRAGVVVASIRGRLLWANHAAEDILNTRDGLEVDAEHTLVLSYECVPFPIEAMLTGYAVERASGGGDRSVQYVHRPSGKRDLKVVVRPTSSFVESQDTEKPAAVVFIQDPERPVHISQTDLRQLYRLTVTECRIANYLMEGSTLEECCKRLDIRPSTARMHLRNLLNKTGTRCQSELVGLLFRNLGLMSAGPVTGSSFRMADRSRKSSAVSS
jgi:DNA-binding CsgD family transcriptional regulator